MEDWELDFEWLRIRHVVQQSMGRETMPDLNSILYLIGVQELGHLKEKFSKEEKQDLMHIATCRLLSYDGYYEFIGRDEDGWPHWKAIAHLTIKGLKDQERLIKENIIRYFKELETENGGF